MRMSVPLVLYFTATGMFGVAGWTIYESRGLWKSETARSATTKGRDDAIRLIARGRGTMSTTSNWDYSATSWWEQFLGINLIAKVPVIIDPGDDPEDDEAEHEQAITPLDDIFELVVSYHDDEGDGKTDKSHVVIRYKQAAEVVPPGWWLDENVPLAAPAAPRSPVARYVRTKGLPSDTAGSITNEAQLIAGRKVLQKLYVDSEGDTRRDARLWGQYSHIRLVRVDASGESAWFVRERPHKAGEPKPELKEEQLLKTSADIPQDVLRALRQLQGREGDPALPNTRKADGTAWLDVENTTRVGNTFHIGRNDEQTFREPKDLFASVHLDTYVSKYSEVRGLIVRTARSELAQSYGVQTGDVLLKINGRGVSSKAQAANLVKRSYERGVRTFTTTWWSNGQEVERVYQARDK